MTTTEPMRRTPAPPSGTFLGMPTFPTNAKAQLNNTQMRKNLRNATTTIRAKRAKVVGEVENWEELRLAGAAIKDLSLIHISEPTRPY